MDELLEELNVSFDDLFKIHTGHHIFNESDDSDSSEDSSSLDENIVPPLYTLDEISKNLVTVGTEENQEGFINREEEHTENNAHTSINNKSEVIAKKLLSYITINYCFLCKRQAIEHYTSRKHYKKVKAWLEARIGNVLNNVNTKYLFCAICNLPLTGNCLAENHYESEDHKTKVKKFCLPCLQSVPEDVMHKHVSSNLHRKGVNRTVNLFKENNLYFKPKKEKNVSITPQITKKSRSINGDEQQNNNLKSKHDINKEKTVNSGKISNPQRIAEKLSLYLTRKYCFICKKNSGGSDHYQSSAHYRSVEKWLQQELASVLDEAQLSDFYCPICNLPLNGYSLAQEHFESKDHITKIENLCLSCLRPVPESGMSEHMKSKKHGENAHETSKFFLQINLSLKLNREENKNLFPLLNIESISNNADDEQNNHRSRLSNTKCKIIQESQQSLRQSEGSGENYKSTQGNNLEITNTVNNVHQSNASKHPNLTEYGILANIIIDLLGPSYCHVCKTGTTDSHYNEGGHNKELEKWILSYTKSHGFHIKNIDDLICFACHAVFPKKKYAEMHYESSEHKCKFEKFCKVCLQHLGEQAENHDTQAEHLEEQNRKKDTEMKQNIMEKNKAFNAEFSDIFVQWKNFNNIKIHEIDVNVIKAIIEEKMDIIAVCQPVVKEVLELMTPIYCFICNKSTLKDWWDVYRHYTYRNHIKELKELLHDKVKDKRSEKINYESLYCEPCNQLLLNLKFAEQHYNSIQHQTKCDPSKLHGSNSHFTPVMSTTEVKQVPLLFNNEKLHGFTNNFVPPNRLPGFNIYYPPLVGANISYAPGAGSINSFRGPGPNNYLSGFRPHNYYSALNGANIYNFIQSPILPWPVTQILPQPVTQIASLIPSNTTPVRASEKLSNERNEHIPTDMKVEEPVCKTTLNDNTLADNKENIASSTSKENPGTVIAEKLKEMISPTYCYICKRNVNMHIFDHHYLEKDHITKVRNWLDEEIRKLGVKIDRRVLYCEECPLELQGTNEGLKHYETATHQFNAKTYCSVCIFRGTPNNIEQHMSSESHKEQLKKPLSTKKQNIQRNSWPKKLTRLITFTECKVCRVKLETTEKADFHYCSDLHNVNVKKWMDNYFLSDDVDNVTENSKQFSCTFCNSNFSSEMELNEHNNTHFPALGGSGYSKKSKPESDIPKKMSKRKKSQKLSEKTTEDTQAKATSEQQISGPDKEEKSIDNIKLEATQDELPYETNTIKKYEHTNLYEEIRTEINKLVETVYFSKALPLEHSLNYLKDLNKKLEEASLSINGQTAENNQEIESGTSNTQITELEYPNLSLTSNEITIQEEYTKTRLSMELYRLKMVLSNTYKISTDSALKYVQNLNDLIENSRTSGPGDFEINIIFEDGRILEGSDLKNKLENELSNLSCSLLDDKKIAVQVALDVITRFNVQLESLLEYQEVNISYDSDY